MARLRNFAALIDQDSVILLEFQQEKAGFRLVDTRARKQRFTSPEAAADAIVDLLGELKARQATVSIVLQHFGSFFHTLVLPPAAPEHVRPIIQREVQRSFNIADPALAFTTGANVERRDPARSGGQVPRQVFIAGAPGAVVAAIQARLSRARIEVDGLTVVPEVFRQLYDSLDGSTEATAVLICLQNGPHVAFFVNGQLELAIEPPLALEGEAPLDTMVIIDQLERGAIFLRQQARGTVATRLLLSAPGPDFESLSSTIEARTGMRVAALGEGVGSPEAVVAMGAVLAARATDRLDLYPRPPAFDERLKAAMTGPGLLVSAVMSLAVVAAFWAMLQVVQVYRERSALESVQARVEREMPAIAKVRESAQGRERIASIRAGLRDAASDKLAIAELMTRVSAASQAGAQVDSMKVNRMPEGMQATVFGQATAPTGPAAMTVATAFYRHFQAVKELKNLEFESAYPARDGTVPASTTGESLRFSVSFLVPLGEQ